MLSVKLTIISIVNKEKDAVLESGTKMGKMVPVLGAPIEFGVRSACNEPIPAISATRMGTQGVENENNVNNVDTFGLTIKELEHVINSLNYSQMKNNW